MADDAPYHAHVYFDASTRAEADALHRRLMEMHAAEGTPCFVGTLRDRKVGPHPTPQFEVHFPKRDLPRLLPVLETAGLTVLVHPLTDDDLADHTTLARWIGESVELDVSVLDPPGVNQGLARFGRTDV